MIRVLIVEDDPMVAAINKKYVELTDGFVTEAVCSGGPEALQYLAAHETDLVILDYYMPEMNGNEFLDRMHSAGYHPAVIMVTSASDIKTVQALMARGVIDYLVKPFAFDRFKAALSRFRTRKDALRGAGEAVAQSTLDALFAGNLVHAEADTVPKGMSVQTLSMIRDYLKENATETFKAEDIAAHFGLSNVTTRRYLNYLTETGSTHGSIDYKTGGRPAMKYRFRSE